MPKKTNNQKNGMVGNLEVQSSLEKMNITCVSTGGNDFGEDLICDIFDENDLKTNLSFRVQVKASGEISDTTQIKPVRGGFSVAIDSELKELWMNCFYPVFVFIVDIYQDKIYWGYVEDSKKRATVFIPIENELNDNTHQSLLEKSKKFYEKLRNNIITYIPLLDAAIYKGDFDVIKHLLEQNHNVNDIKTKKLLKYYEFVYNFFCNKSNYENSFNEYLSIGKDEIDEKAVSFLIENLEITKINLLLDCKRNDELSKLAKIVIDSNYFGTIITNGDETPYFVDNNIQISASRALINYCFKNKMTHIQFELTNGASYFYSFINKLLEADNVIDGRNTNDNIEKELIYYQYMVNSMDTYYQQLLYQRLLRITDYINLDNLIKSLPIKIKESPIIKETIYKRKLFNGEKINFTEIYQNCQKLNNLSNIYIFISDLNNKKDKTVIKYFKILNDYIYNDKVIFYLYFDAIKIFKINIDLDELFGKAVIILGESFLFNCLLCYKDFDNNIDINDKINNLNIQRKIKNIDIREMLIFIDLLILTNRNDIIYTLDWVKYPLILKEEFIELLVKRFEEYVILIKDISEDILIIKDNTRYNYLYGKANLLIGNVINAETYLTKSFIIGLRNENLAIDILNIRINNNIFAIDEVVNYAKASLNSNLLYLVGMYFAPHDILQAKNCVLKSLIIDPSNTILYPSYLNLILKDQTNITMIQNDCVVKLVSNDIIRIFCIHDSNYLNFCIDKNFAECEHINLNSSYGNILHFNKVNDIVNIDGINFKIVEIEDKESYFCKYIFKNMIEKKENCLVISGNSNFLISSIQTILKDKKDYNIKTLTEYENNCIPFTLLSKYLGISYIDCLQAVFYDKDIKIKIQNNNNVVDNCKVFVLGADILILMYNLQIKVDAFRKECKFIIPKLVKAGLLNNINHLRKNYQDMKIKGMISADNDIIFNEYTNDKRRITIKKINEFEEFINSFEVTEKSYDLIEEDTQIKKTIIEANLIYEKDLISFCQVTQNCCLVSDDKFCIKLANYYDIHNIGVIGLLEYCSFDNIMLLNISRELAEMNFSAFMNISFLETYSKLFNTQNSSVNEKLLYDFVNFINNLLLDKINNIHFENLIIELAQRTYTEETKINFNIINVLRNYSFKIISSRNPKLIENIVKAIRCEVVQDNEQYYLSTVLLDDKNRNC